MTPNPYAADLGDREPVAAMKEAVDRIQTLTASWTPEQFERSYATGKWTARQILTHLAQTEIALGNRARMALTTPNYAAQSFDQDQWMLLEGSGRPSRGLSGRDALAALVATNAMNRALFASLSQPDRQSTFTHPEYGGLNVDWVIHQMAGHVRHHLERIERIARG